MKFALSTYPETIPHVIAQSFRLYRLVFVRVFVLSFILSTLAFIPRLTSIFIGHPLFVDTNLFSVQRLWLFLVELACLTVLTGVLWRIRCVLTDAHESMLTDIKVALKKLPYAFVAALIQFVLVVCVLLLFVLFTLHYVVYHQALLTPDLKNAFISGFLLIVQFILVSYVYFSLCFYLPIILVENKGIFSSLSESMYLVWRNWWRTMVVQLTPWVLYLVFLGFFRSVTHLQFNYQYGLVVNLLVAAVYIILFAAFIPWPAATLMVQLRDLEIRKGMRPVINEPVKSTQ